jgi:transcriptional regulator with PAS, ATPase and Fis domain
MLLCKIEGTDGMSERDIFYKVLIDLRKDVNDLKKVVFGLLEGNINGHNPLQNNTASINSLVPVSIQSNNYPDNTLAVNNATNPNPSHHNHTSGGGSNSQPIFIHSEEDDIEFEETTAVATDIHETFLSLEAQEIEMIKKALQKNNGKRKKAAAQVGISERTLYRKIKQYNLE